MTASLRNTGIADAGPFPDSATAARISGEVRSALASRTALRIEGGGSWMDAGAPVAFEKRISVRQDSGIVEYEPGDLTLSALAGTPLRMISAVAAENSQWLPLDPFGGGAATIGATIATASSGPLAQMFGTPRDQLLGVEFVSGTGDIVRGGGRVTKNVAGFDLSRLVCGAWGTLGVLTEITMRLRALPERDDTLSIPLDGGTEGMIRTMQALHESGVAPAAMELLDATLCAKLGIAQSPSAEGAVLLRFCGNEAGVAVQTGRIQGAFPAIAHGSDIWRAYISADIDGDGVAVVRLSARPSALPSLWDFATGLRGRVAGTVMTASAGRGIVRCAFPAQSLSGIADELSRRPPSSMIFEKLPADLWPLLAPPDQIADRLHQRVRDAFDPHRILNRGILGEAPQ